MATPASWSPSFPPPHWTEKKRPETLESDRLPRRHNPSQLAMPYSSPPFTDRNLSSVVIQTQGRYRPQSDSGSSKYALAGIRISSPERIFETSSIAKVTLPKIGR